MKQVGLFDLDTGKATPEARAWMDRARAIAGRKGPSKPRKRRQAAKPAQETEPTAEPASAEPVAVASAVVLPGKQSRGPSMHLPGWAAQLVLTGTPIEEVERMAKEELRRIQKAMGKE